MSSIPRSAELADPDEICGLIAHWALDETDGLIAHDRAGGRDGTVIGAATWRPTEGIVAGALELNGATFVATDFVLNPQAVPFSVLAWTKGGAPGQVILSQVGGVNWLMADPAGGVLMTELKGAGRVSTNLSSQTVITDGDWHRVGFVCDGSSRMLYADDVVVAEDPEGPLVGSMGGLYIGAASLLAADSFWSGLIDDVRIYNRAAEP